MPGRYQPHYYNFLFLSLGVLEIEKKIILEHDISIRIFSKLRFSRAIKNEINLLNASLL